MSKARRNRSYPFDARSVVLFAAIAVSGFGAHAQSPASKSAAKTSATATRGQGASSPGTGAAQRTSSAASRAAPRAVFGGTSPSASPASSTNPGASAATPAPIAQARSGGGQAL